MSEQSESNGWGGVFICIKWSVTPISPRKSKGGVATKPEPDKAGEKAKK